MNPLIEMRDLSKRFGGVVALERFSGAVAEREIVGILGPNGAGKTTLFNIFTGLLPPDSGDVEYRGTSLLGLRPQEISNLGLTRIFQELRLVRCVTVLANVLFSFRKQPGENLINVFLRPSFCRRHEGRNREKAIELLRAAGLSEKASDLAESLSYGQQKLLTLVCCLAADAELLLLDEPVAGIAPEMADRILAIIGDLPRQGKSAIVIEHDVEALKGIGHRLIFMDAGRKICEGTPDEVLNDPRVIEAYLD